MDSFLFFLGWLAQGMICLIVGVALAHSLPVAVAYWRNGYGFLHYKPQCLPGTEQAKQGIFFYPNADFMSSKSSDRYKLTAVHLFSNAELPVLYYLLSVAYRNEPTMNYIILPGVLRMLLLSIMDAVRQHDVEKGEVSRIGHYRVTYHRRPTEYLQRYHRNDNSVWDLLLLQRNFVQVGRDRCMQVLVRDVMFETARHLGAQVRADMNTWQIPAKRTFVAH